MAGVTFQITGDKALRNVLVGLRRPLDNAERTNKKVAIQLYQYVMDVFAAEGAHDGRPAWAPLKAGGRYSKGRFRTAYRLLQDTGQLRQSYEPIYDKTSAGVGSVASRPHSDLAPIHEYGNPERNLPARPMLPSVEVLQSTVLTIYGLEFEKALAGARA